MTEQKSPLENLMIMSQRLDQLDGQFDWSDEIQQIRAALSHAEGEPVPNERGKNRFGLDMSYFRNAINRELNRPLTDYRPDELARVFARLARTADPAVMAEPEFTPTAPRVVVPEGWTDRHTRVTRFALWRLINEGYHRANIAAQKGQPGTAADAAALLDDVERAEEARNMLAARLRAGKEGE